MYQPMCIVELSVYYNTTHPSILQANSPANHDTGVAVCTLVSESNATFRQADGSFFPCRKTLLAGMNDLRFEHAGLLMSNSLTQQAYTTQAVNMTLVSNAVLLQGGLAE